MKYTIIYTWLLALLFTSCSDYLDVNTDPNNPNVVTPNLILPVAQVYTADYIQKNRRVNHLGNMMMYNYSQSNGYSWYNDEFGYNVTTTFYDEVFDDAFKKALKQYKELSILDSSYDYYRAIAMIMRAYHFQILVDCYGDVPYTEALQRGANPTPAYDNGSDIYNNLLVSCTEAIDIINAASERVGVVAVGTDDIMFHGDMDEWKKMANTVKLRLITRISDVRPEAEIKAELAAIASEGSGFVTSDVIINPGYKEKVENKQNPFWNDLYANSSGEITMNHKATCATDYVLTYLSSTNDPRLAKLFREGENGHLGVPQGLDTDETYDPDQVSLIGDGVLKSAEMGANILTLAEVNFNQAELIEQGLLAGNAKEFYEAGITASCKYLGVSEDDTNTYLALGNDNVSYDNSFNKLQAIITQKWIATMSITAEQSWFDYSRTGFPKGLPVSLKASTSDRPVRLVYPSSEITGNTQNVPAQKDAFTDKIFWAK